MTDHPITPPPRLVEKWDEEGAEMFRPEYQIHLTTRAAQWGADQELEACCALMDDWGLDGNDLMECRRPKPPNLKRIALLQLDTLNADLGLEGKGVDLSQIRRALEALPDD